MFGEQLACDEAAGVFHPARCRPGGGEDGEVGADLQDLLQDRDDMREVRTEGKAEVLRVAGIFVVGEWLGLQVGSPHRDPENAHADAAFFHAKELAEQRGSGGVRHPVDVRSAASGEGEAKACHVLSRLQRVDGDGAGEGWVSILDRIIDQGEPLGAVCQGQVLGNFGALVGCLLGRRALTAEKAR